MKTRWGGNEIRLTKTWVPNEVGELAIRFATHFGVIAATESGEDSQGRAKIALQSPQQVIDRACEMAQLLTDKMKANGWIVDLPDLPEEEPDLMPAKDLKKAPPDEGSLGVGAPPQGGA